MKKWKLILVMGMLILACAGCGTQKADNVQSSEEVPVVETQTESEPTENEVEERNDSYDDLEEKGDSGEAAAFAEQIQAAAANKDMDALADLCFYPLAVNGEVIDNKDAFMALGEDVIFTEERCAVIAAVDVSSLEETMAGIIMGDATPNIIFKSVDGELGITGIN
ncbi:MAG: hypothetical protein K2J99_12120 [Lachnospiraceae bacterium]|nr:hypothetical protein [Lachnospiraceae bacterium]